MVGSGRLHLGGQMNAKEREKRFCFRTQFKTFGDMAEMLVGPEKTKFLIHKDVAVAHSPFFAAALNGHFAEGNSGQLLLPDVEPKVFEHVVTWIYQQRLDDPNVFFKDGKPTYFTLLDIYSLADQLCVEALRNAVIDLMADLADQTNSVPTPMDTTLLYENIRDNAPIRRLILDLFAFKKTDNLVSTHPDPWHPTFLRDLVCKLKRPGSSALTRHDLHPWRPAQWPHTKACDVCRNVLKPNVNANICSGCNRAVCAQCVARGGVGGGCEWSVAEKECKPWGTGPGRCEYHEHLETERCEFGNGSGSGSGRGRDSGERCGDGGRG